jgi:hypothetical protein
MSVLYPLSLIGNEILKRHSEYERNNRNIRGIVFYAVRVVSQESMRLFLIRTSYLFKSCNVDVCDERKISLCQGCTARICRTEEIYVNETVVEKCV